MLMRIVNQHKTQMGRKKYSKEFKSEAALNQGQVLFIKKLIFNLTSKSK